MQVSKKAVLREADDRTGHFATYFGAGRWGFFLRRAGHEDVVRSADYANAQAAEEERRLSARAEACVLYVKAHKPQLDLDGLDYVRTQARARMLQTGTKVYVVMDDLLAWAERRPRPIMTQERVGEPKRKVSMEEYAAAELHPRDRARPDAANFVAYFHCLSRGALHNAAWRLCLEIEHGMRGADLDRLLAYARHVGARLSWRTKGTFGELLDEVKTEILGVANEARYHRGYMQQTMVRLNISPVSEKQLEEEQKLEELDEEDPKRLDPYPMRRHYQEVAGLKVSADYADDDEEDTDHDAD